MGACSFETQGIGRTVAEAYRDAYDTAVYEYGHQPYSGTISVKDGYVEFVLPAGVKLADVFKAISLQQEQDYGRTKYVIGADGKGKLRQLPARKMPVWTTRYTDWKRLYETYQDKWGPAVAIKVGPARQAKGRRWVWEFMGYASC
jgi:hypothetical protein